MKSHLTGLKKTNTKSQTTGNRYKRFIQGALISIILISTPFLFYLYRLAPKADTWDLGFMVLNNGGFSTVKVFVHALMTKLMFLIFTTIWFFTSKHWWRFSILIPFGLFFFQTTGVINQNIKYTEDFNFWSVVPMLLPILIGMILVSIKLNKETRLLDIREQISIEMEEIKQKRRAS